MNIFPLIIHKFVSSIKSIKYLKRKGNTSLFLFLSQEYTFIWKIFIMQGATIHPHDETNSISSNDTENDS
jgi:hypothetical protein